jgi:hypothetical protein
VKALAEAVVVAVTRLTLREDRADYLTEGDVEAIEQVAAILRGATDAEKRALVEAASQLKDKEERASTSRQGYLDMFARWMTGMGFEEPAGNKKGHSSISGDRRDECPLFY